MVSDNFPQHMAVGARSGFLTALQSPDLTAWKRIAGIFNMDARAETVVSLGSAPMPTESTGGGPFQSFVERSLAVKAKEWDTFIRISYAAVRDDQTGKLYDEARMAGEKFNQHMSNLIFKALDAGDASTYGLCYDGNEFFDASHIDKGAAYTTAQSNTNALALSLDNFNTVFTAASLFKDDQGEYTEHPYDLLVVNPTLRTIAAQICDNPDAYDTGNRERNPNAGLVQYTQTPHFSTTAWGLFSTRQVAKPIYMAIREQPNLQAYGFDEKGPDGGTYWLKFHAAYNMYYGDWRLAIMGNS
jgi:phage major head subunit gpT-like protein